MDIRNPRALMEDARRALNRGRDPKKLVFYYAAAIALISAALTVANYLLSTEMSGMGGLGNLGMFSILSTGQTLIPIIQMVALLGVEFGYLYGIMRITRGQYADHTDLKTGFRFFGPVLRMNLLQGLLFFALGIAIFYFSLQIFLITPLGKPLVDLLTPIVAAGTTVLDEATAAQAYPLMIPMLIIFAILFAAVSIPLLYRFRMANYALLDEPRAGAIAALRASSRMMKRKCLKLFRLDLAFWWYYTLQVLVTVLCYGDVILSMLGISLPVNATISYYLFYALYLAGLFLLNYYLRNSVEAAYIVAYDDIREKKEENSIVLGNIFEI